MRKYLRFCFKIENKIHTHIYTILDLNKKKRENKTKTVI